eukprot:sb/3473705/
MEREAIAHTVGFVSNRKGHTCIHTLPCYHKLNALSLSLSRSLSLSPPSLSLTPSSLLPSAVYISLFSVAHSFQCLFLSFSLYLSLSQSPSLFLSFSISLSVISLSLSLSLSLSVFLSGWAKKMSSLDQHSSRHRRGLKLGRVTLWNK